MDQIIGKAMSSGIPAGANPLVAAAIQLLTRAGGIGGLQQRFQSLGLASVVDSWIGQGPNQAIDSNQLNQVFKRDEIEEAAQRSGLPANDLIQQLASFLPQLVNGLTPQGQVPQQQPGMADLIKMGMGLLGRS